MQGRQTTVIIGATIGVTLAAYTRYAVHVDACTGGGCTRSPALVLTTLADVPRGLQAPVVSGVRVSTARVTWAAPDMPNGPNLR